MTNADVGTSMCEDGEIRLVGRDKFNESEGQVDMCYNGVWGRVCADGWNKMAANIVCNQLEYRNYSKFSSLRSYM